MATLIECIVELYFEEVRSVVEGIKNLNLNVNVTVFAPGGSNPNDPSSQMVKGRIYNGEGDESVIVELDSGYGDDAPTSGKPIMLFLAHDLGLYILSATVGSVCTERGKIMMRCLNPQQVKYFQRRKSVRIKASIPVSFSAESDRSRVWEGTITDISVGGLQLEAPFLIPMDSVLELVYQLEDIGPMFMDGKVVRAYEKKGSFIHGLEFANTDQLYIDSIAKFIMAEQLRQKRLGLNVFKAFILKASVEIQLPTVFSIIGFKSVDISALKGKKCTGNITEIGINNLKIECPLKLPVGAILEFDVELPRVGHSTVRAVVKNIEVRSGKFILDAVFGPKHEKVRDCVLDLLSKDFEVPYMK